MLKLKHGIVHPKIVYDISSVESLAGITEDEVSLHIGAALKLRCIVKAPKVMEFAPLLSHFAGEIGSMEVRNAGTVGGNLCASRANCGICFLPGCHAMTADRNVPPCRSSSYADLLLPLIAYGASVKIMSKADARLISVKDFFIGGGRINLKPQELLAEIVVPKAKHSRFGVSELRQPVKMGFPYISVIAEEKGGVFDLTVGGSTDKIYTFENAKTSDFAKLCEGVDFTAALRLSEDYRKQALLSVVADAAENAVRGRA